MLNLLVCNLVLHSFIPAPTLPPCLPLYLSLSPFLLPLIHSLVVFIFHSTHLPLLVSRHNHSDCLSSRLSNSLIIFHLGYFCLLSLPVSLPTLLSLAVIIFHLLPLTVIIPHSLHLYLRLFLHSL